MENWKVIKEYPDYKVSNLGRVKSFKYGKERFLKGGVVNTGYICVCLSLNGKLKTKMVHQLVATAFLNHNTCGIKLVVNHINFIKTDNRLENLEIVTNRENTNKKHLKSTSKYIGVNWNKQSKKWASYIYIYKKRYYLGLFTSEIEASNAYNKKLKEFDLQTTKKDENNSH
jgi:hypothetical protein